MRSHSIPAKYPASPTAGTISYRTWYIHNPAGNLAWRFMSIGATTRIALALDPSTLAAEIMICTAYSNTETMDVYSLIWSLQAAARPHRQDLLP